jgi:putative toxin-antitoxin system antitoxin component (TIGR02293 family)
MTESRTDAPSLERYWERVASGHAGGHAYAALLGLHTFDTPGLLRKIREGISFAAYERFLKTTSLSREAAADVLQIPARTLNRRREEGRLHADESDRLLRVARLFARALELCEGDESAARTWLTSPADGLGGATPLEYAATEVGALEVDALIGRTEHGIPS